MAGQDAANIAKTFNASLELTGVVLTKMDGDARGGAALSMRMITGKPIKFMGVGEKIDALEVFHPERVASRILGMGDILTLVEEAASKVDKVQAEKMAKKLQKGHRFDFNDFLAQLQQMNKMGGMQQLLSKLPTQLGKMPQAAAMMDNKVFIGMEAIIYSMTPKERIFPALINGSRKRRIAQGSGRDVQEVNKMLKQFEQMQKMMKKFKGGSKMMKKLQQMQHQLPPELMGKLPPFN
jgi:signal recognition particle subunit SRP54